MRVAYADPPYLGWCAYYAHAHPDGRCWNDGDTHLLLIERLVRDYPDGWALSLSSSSLRTILPACPDDVRVGAWVKPFCSWKPDVNPAFTWEPIIWRGGRVTTYRAGGTTIRDHIAAPMTMRRGLTGVKPDAVCWWLFALLGLRSDDQLDDLFPGSGAVGRAWQRYAGRSTAPGSLLETQGALLTTL